MTTLPDTLCYLNGDYSPVNQAKVSVLDRGFIFGDGVYEVVPVYGRKLFRFDEHVARLGRSLEKTRIVCADTAAHWLERCRHLVASHAAEDQIVYIQITRGVAIRDHVMPTNITPTVFMMVSEMKVPSADQRHKGVSCVTARDFRWERGDIKSTSLLGAVMSRQMSADHAALENLVGSQRHAAVDDPFLTTEVDQMAAAFITAQHATLDDLAEREPRAEFTIVGKRDRCTTARQLRAECCEVVDLHVRLTRP